MALIEVVRNSVTCSHQEVDWRGYTIIASTIGSDHDVGCMWRYAVCNTELNNFICLRKSEVTVERILVCNVIKN